MPDGPARDAKYQDITREFAKQLYDLWAQYTLWVVAMKPNVHGVLATKLPDGTGAFEGLPTGHEVTAMWCDAGKC
jgi:hypothetical protein